MAWKPKECPSRDLKDTGDNERENKQEKKENDNEENHERLVKRGFPAPMMTLAVQSLRHLFYG